MKDIVPFYFFHTRKAIYVPRQHYRDDIQKTVRAGLDAKRATAPSANGGKDKCAYVIHKRLPRLVFTRTGELRVARQAMQPQMENVRGRVNKLTDPSRKF